MSKSKKRVVISEFEAEKEDLSRMRKVRPVSQHRFLKRPRIGYRRRIWIDAAQGRAAQSQAQGQPLSQAQGQPSQAQGQPLE